MSDVRPRNWQAMRDDRVLAMAENRFGERFASKEAAIAKLQTLSPREQRSLRKTHVSRAESARRASASERMVAGMSQGARMPTIDERLKGLKKAQLQAVAKDMGMSVASKVSAAKIRTAILQEQSRLGHAASKGYVASRTGGAWGGERAIVDADRRGAVASARSGFEGRVNAAIDKVAAATPAKASKAARAPKAPASNPARVHELTAKVKGALASSSRSEIAAVQAELQASKLSKVDSHALAKALDMPVKASAPGKSAVTAVTKRLGALSSFLTKQAAVGGRSAAAFAVAVGAGLALAAMDGSNSGAQAAQKRKQSSGPSKNTVEAKKAEAAAKQADAESAKAQAETRRLELEAKAREDDRADKRRADDKSPLEQVRQVGLVAAPLAAGIVAGNKKAQKLQAQAEKSVAMKDKQLTAVTKRIRNTTNVNKLTAAVKTADAMKLTKSKTTLGGPTVALLAAEAIALRAVAMTVENETAKEVLNAGAIGLGAAAVTTLGSRLAEKANPTVQVNAGLVQEIETARETVHGKAQAKAARAKKAPGKGMLAKAGRAVLPVLATVAAVSAYNSGAEAAEANGGDATDARAQGATEATKALTDLLTFGAGEATAKAVEKGHGRAEAVAYGLTVGAVNTATLGGLSVVEMANDAMAEQGGFTGFVGDTIANGVKAASEDLGKLLGWSDAARIAAAQARGVAEPGKAFLNDAAERKASAPEKAPASTVVAASAAPKKSDGETNSYARRGKNGQTIQVKAYRTPDRR